MSKMPSTENNRTLAYRRIQHLLENSEVPYILHTHPAVITVEDARTKVPHLAVNLIKTIVFQIKDESWILAGVNSTDRIHYKQLGDALGINRKLIRSVSPLDVETKLGFKVGGVGPFPIQDNIRVILDKDLMKLGQIFCGSGRNTVTVEMNIEDLAAVTKAKIAAIRRFKP